MKKIFESTFKIKFYYTIHTDIFPTWNKELLKVLSLKGDLKQQGLTVPVTLRKL